ncbi:MAG: CsgG/HfaB family protein [bacterium]
MYKKITWFTVVCIIFISIQGMAYASLDDQISALSSQIATKMTEQKKHTIAVIEFADLQGNVTNFGRFLSEELITKLFETGKFKVIERQLLDKVIAEQKLSLQGMVDPESAKKLGKILGVDAICSGTITDLGQSLEVNARLISTETGEIIAVASTKIFKDDSVLHLMSEGVTTTAVSQPVGTTPPPENTPTPKKLAGLKPGMKFNIQDAVFELANCLRVSLISIEIKKNETIANFVIQNLQKEEKSFSLVQPDQYTYLMDQDDNQYKYISSTGLTDQQIILVPVVKKNFSVQFEPLPSATQKIDIMFRIFDNGYCGNNTYNGWADVAIKNIKLQ